jgi:catechol 2,3-dioxygenase-like lactoylglutathione lyase family enzyme
MVHDVDEAVAFYVSKLGFELQEKYGSAIAIVARDDLELIFAGPKTSAAQPMADGSKPTPGGGWSRFVLTVDDLESYVAELGDQGVEFKNEIVDQQGRKQIICVDPSGNIIELFQPPESLYPYPPMICRVGNTPSHLVRGEDSCP